MSGTGFMMTAEAHWCSTGPADCCSAEHQAGRGLTVGWQMLQIDVLGLDDNGAG